MNQTVKTLDIYWANLCILNRIEGEKMETAAGLWQRETGDTEIRMVYLGDTERIGIYEKLDTDIRETDKPDFDAIISTRLDIFCSDKYLQSYTDELMPINKHFKLRPEIEELGVADEEGLFLPLVVLPHFIIVNTEVLGNQSPPESLKDLLEPEWEGKVYIGSADLPSARSVLLAICYLYGREGLDKAVKYWRQKSAPSAARHGLIKDEFPIAILPGVFSGPGPKNKLMKIVPADGAPVLPSFAAVQKGESAEATLDFLKKSAVTNEFIEFYKNQATAYPALASGPDPAEADQNLKMVYPSWQWLKEQDIEEFIGICAETPMG